MGPLCLTTEMSDPYPISDTISRSTQENMKMIFQMMQKVGVVPEQADPADGVSLAQMLAFLSQPNQGLPRDWPGQVELTRSWMEWSVFNFENPFDWKTAFGRPATNVEK